MKIKGITFFLEGRKAETFKHCAMSVDFDRLNTAHRVKNQEDKPCYVIASNDLQLLCQSFLISHTVLHSIFWYYQFRVTIHRMFDDMLSNTPAQTSPQRRLLEPLTVLHSVAHFEIAGPANTEYCASIAAQVSRIAPTVGECFDKTMELKYRGLTCVRQNDLVGAVKFYRMAFAQLISTCLRRHIVGTDWTAFHPGLQGAIVNTYLILLADLAFLHYNLDELDDAHLWAYQATRSDLRSPRMRHQNLGAKLVYLKAMASARLGNHARAIDELCQGLRFVTREAYKDRHLVAVRREARYQIKGLGGITVLKAMGIGHL